MSIPDEALDRCVRVYAVANWHTRRIHGMTCDVNESARWVREICENYGPDAASQCVDLVDPQQQDIPWAEPTPEDRS